MLQVQPMELLLGTDTLHELGFSLTQTGSVDLLKGKTTGSDGALTTRSKEEEGSNTSTPSTPKSEKATVKLLGYQLDTPKTHSYGIWGFGCGGGDLPV